MTLPNQSPDGSLGRKDSTRLTRRHLLTGLGSATAGAAVASFALWPKRESLDHHGLSPASPRNAKEALKRLRAGNECYIEEHFQIGEQGRTTRRRTEIASAQHPYAVVLACADSRVPPEIIFSAGLG